MGFWGSLKEAFGFAEKQPKPTDYGQIMGAPSIEISPTIAPRAGMQASAQTLFSSSPRESVGYGGIMGNDPGYFEGIESSSSGFLGSLWSSFKSFAGGVKETVTGIYQEAKEVAPEATRLYKEIHGITKPMDTTSLFAREPSRGFPSSPDQVLYTPYPRSSTGAKPAVITTGNGKGFPVSLLLIAGVAAFFLLSKRR